MLVLITLVEFYQLIVELLDVRQLHMHLGLIVVLANLKGEVALSHVVIKGANLKFVAALLVALDPFVLVRMVKTFDSCVALNASKPIWAKVPANTLDERLAVFRVVLEDVRRSAKVTHVVCIDTTLGVMRVFIGWAPTRLIEKHIKQIPIVAHVHLLQFVFQIRACQKAARHEVVLDTFVLKAVVDFFDPP